MEGALGWREGAGALWGSLGAALLAALLVLVATVHEAHARRQHIYIENLKKVDDMYYENKNRSDSSDDTEQCTFDTNDLMDSSIDGLHSRVKIAHHQAIVTKMSENMTPEQLMEEKEVEKEQLNAILSLLKEQKEKFQVSNMEELEEQLSLYR